MLLAFKIYIIYVILINCVCVMMFQAMPFFSQLAGHHIG